MSPARPLPGGSARLYRSHAADHRWRMTADGGYCEQGSPGDDRTIHTMTAFIDLRSDTVTRPTEAMRNAMAEAEVGDDWYGDDPTVNRLQHRAAEITGRQAALYLPTGTMCTQIALHALVRSGHLVVCESTAHVCGMEQRSSSTSSRSRTVTRSAVARYSRWMMCAPEAAARGSRERPRPGRGHRRVAAWLGRPCLDADEYRVRGRQRDRPVSGRVGGQAGG